MSRLWPDIRLAARLLASSPGFTAVAVISLALGIGANTAIFSLINGLLLVPTPGRDHARLVTVYTSDSSGPLHGASSYPDYVDFRDRSQAFEDLAAHTLQPLLVTVRGESRRVMGALVTGNTFGLLGLQAAHGRLLLAVEQEPGRHPVVVLSHAFWTSHFGADPAVVGQDVFLNGRPHAIVGVAPKGLTGLLRGVSVDVFVPLAMQEALGGESLEERGHRGLMLIGRLRDGVSIDAARTRLAVVARQQFTDHPGVWSNVRGEGRTVSVLAERESRLLPQISTPVTAFLAVLMCVVVLVLALACSNVAGLLLARASARRRELAVRLAVGARSSQIVGQFLTESVLLALFGGGLGIGLAVVAMHLVERVRLPLPVTPALGLSLDHRVLVFALALSTATGVVFGLLPAWRASQTDPIASIKMGGDAPRRTRRLTLRDGLVIGQVAVSLLLLVGAGLLLRSLANAGSIDPGFTARGVLAFSVDLSSRGYDEARGRVLYDQLLERLAALPGADAVSLASRVPLALGGGRRGIGVDGYTPAPGEDMEVHYSVVGAGYFETMRTALAEGRAFDRADAGGPGAVVVNEAFVRRFWPGQTALGRRVIVPHRQAGQVVEDSMVVVGIARDGKYTSLGEDPTPFVFLPASHLFEPEMTVLVRTGGSPTALVPGIRQAVAALDPGLPVYDVRTLEQHVGLSLFPVRAVAWLLGAMGGLALLLAGIGLYGALAYAIARRTREIGVRMALGAAPRDVMASVVGQALRLSAIGTGLGLAAAFGATRFLAFLLYGLSPLDPATFAGMAILLAAVGVAAAAVPARRAARVDPVEALRAE